MRQKQFMKIVNKVNHDFKYHAEIQYENEHGFMMTKAVGNTIQEILEEIKLRLEQYKERSPEILEVLYEPNKECINITPKITSLILLGR